MIYFEVVEDTVWPVDIGTADEDSAEWTLRYGSSGYRENQRLSIASILRAYQSLTDPNQSLKDATAQLRRARKAHANALAVVNSPA